MMKMEKKMGEIEFIKDNTYNIYGVVTTVDNVTHHVVDSRSFSFVVPKDELHNTHMPPIKIGLERVGHYMSEYFIPRINEHERKALENGLSKG